MKKLFLLLTLMTLSLAAQTTSSQLKTQIDTDITNKTGPNSISKANVGNNLKDIVDYVDQMAITKTIKITLSSSDILSIYTTPKEVVPAVSGKLLIPRFIYQKYTHVTTAYTGGATWRIGLGSINNAFAVISAVIGSADNSQAIQAFSQGWSASGSSYDGLNIIIGAASANPTGGDGTLELYITYLEITL